MYVPTGVAWSRQEPYRRSSAGSPPQPGDVVHFTSGRWLSGHTDKPGTGDHVGIVESWNGARPLTTIEGNVGTPQGVYRMRRSINAVVINFWRPLGVYADKRPPPPPTRTGDEDM